MEPAILDFQHPKETANLMPFSHLYIHKFQPSAPTIGISATDPSKQHPYRKYTASGCYTIERNGTPYGQLHCLKPTDRIVRCMEPFCTAWQHLNCFNHWFRNSGVGYPGPQICPGDSSHYASRLIIVEGRSQRCRAFGFVEIGPNAEWNFRYTVRENKYVSWQEEENEKRTRGFCYRENGKKVLVKGKPIDWRS